MKNGKKPTRKQCELIQSMGLNADNWLVVKSLSDELHLVNRYVPKQKIIPI